MKKKCSRCKLEKDLNEFSNLNSGPMGKNYACKECHKLYRTQNKEKIALQKKEYMSRPEVKKRRDNYIKEYQKRPEYKEKYNANMRRYKKNNINAKIAHRLRNALSRAATKLYKSESSRKLLGIPIQEFKIYIESLWEEGMSWENYGEHKLNEEPRWNFDHILPISSFNLRNVKEQKKCFHYTNIRPRWGEENLDKSDWIEIDGKTIRARILKNKIKNSPK